MRISDWSSDVCSSDLPQFGPIRDASRAFGLATLEMDGFEADDLIATYARIAHEAGMEVCVVSSDKDLMQLVRASSADEPGVGMLDPMKDRSIGPAEVMEKFGVAPDKENGRASCRERVCQYV